MDKYEGDDAITVKLAHDNDELTVWPSKEVPGGVAFSLADSQEEHVNVGIASREEALAFVAAVQGMVGAGALPLAERIEAAAVDADTSAAAWSYQEHAERDKGKAEGLREAARMVRAAGPTVPRTAIASLLAEIDALECEHSDAILGIRGCLAALLGGA